MDNHYYFVDCARPLKSRVSICKGDDDVDDDDDENLVISSKSVTITGGT